MGVEDVVRWIGRKIKALEVFFFKISKHFLPLVIPGIERFPISLSWWIILGIIFLVYFVGRGWIWVRENTYIAGDLIYGISVALDSVQYFVLKIISSLRDVHIHIPSFTPYNFVEELDAYTLSHVGSVCWNFASFGDELTAMWGFTGGRFFCRLDVVVSPLWFLRPLVQLFYNPGLFNLPACTISVNADICFWLGMGYFIVGIFIPLLVIFFCLVFRELFYGVLLDIILGMYHCIKKRYRPPHHTPTPVHSIH